MVVPAKAKVFAQLVESPVLAAMSSLYRAPMPSSSSQLPEAATGTAAAVPEDSKGGASLTGSILSRSWAHDWCKGLPQNPNLDDRATLSSHHRSPVQELHLDALWEAGMVRPLGRPQEVLSFDLARPPMEDSEVEVQVI